jgi:MFS transporter, CP family, cyanate transporter
MCVGITVVTWLPPLALARGASGSYAAAHLLFFQGVQLIAMLLLPLYYDRRIDRRPTQTFCLLVTTVGVLMLIPSELTTTTASVVFLGVGIGGATGLGMLLISDVGGSPMGSARVGGLAFLVAFLSGAVAPGVLGFLLDQTGTYAAGLLTLLVPLLGAIVGIRHLAPGRTL